MKLHYQKRGGPLDLSLSVVLETHNREQLTEAEAKDLEQFLTLSHFWTLNACHLRPTPGHFLYVLSVEMAEKAHSVSFSSISYVDNPYLWRIIDLVESLCYRACAAEERPHQPISCCSP